MDKNNEMKKPKLLLIIDTLKKGGAETLLVGILAQLNIKFEVILVTLSADCDFNKENIICSERYNLGFKRKTSLVFSILKLRRIIKKHVPALVHSHLIYSSIVARCACPHNIPVLYSIHGELSKNDFDNSKILRFIERNTIRENHSLIAVSNAALADYKKTIFKTNKTFILPNFIADHYFKQNVGRDRNAFKSLNLISVGNFKAAKNYEYLVQSFRYLKDLPVSLKIYGNIYNPVYSQLQSDIHRYELEIVLKGPLESVQEELFNNDLFVMSSKNEGFGMAAIEAMASGLPLLLSDLPVFHEVTFDNALFFDLKDPMSFVALIKEILEGKHNLNQLSHKGIEIAKQYNKEKYLADLYSIYDEILQ
jgi:glycosyltransferase involved in cell wall biosynthesis